MGTGLLVFVWVLQTGYLIFRLNQHQTIVDLSLLEYLFILTWLLITCSLVLNKFYHIEFIVFFVNVVGFAFLLLNFFHVDEETGASIQTWEIVRKLLYIHISLIICAYAVLTITAVFAGMYVFMHRQLKYKRWTSFTKRFPSLGSIELYMHRGALIGTPMLVLSLTVAVTSILVEKRFGLLLDPKVIGSFIALGLFSWTLVKRRWFDGTALMMAKGLLIGYALLLLNLWINSLSSFHGWS